MSVIQKAALPLIVDEQGNPIALIYFSKNRERVIYTMEKAGEEEIVHLFEHAGAKSAPVVDLEE